MKLFVFFAMCTIPFWGWAQPVRDTLPGELITIPVVIHLLYNTISQNISNAQVLSQLEVLNNDYRKRNGDWINTPAVFAALAADAKINFCLARVDPKGRPTSGIIRKHTNEQAWVADDAVKFSSSGGDDAWDAKKYLNIWVCNLFGRNLGYSSLPVTSADKDGVVIQFDVFGFTGSLKTPFDKGRTLTHEIGHWLGLKHLWGDTDCGDDGIADTPPQKSYHTGCPGFPQLSTCSTSSNGDMYMNYMDFTDDACMNMFTRGQAKAMRSMFALGGVRNSFLYSSVCDSTGAVDAPLPEEIAPTLVSIYPNPLVNAITIEANYDNFLAGKAMQLTNTRGQVVRSLILSTGKNTLNLADLSAGIYFMRIGNGKEMKIIKIVKL